MSAPRGSAEQINTIFRDAVKRGKEIIDGLVKQISASGYPPLTEPVTLQALMKMPKEQAVAFLRSELKRTMMDDPVTGDKMPHPKTVELAVKYLESQHA